MQFDQFKIEIKNIAWDERRTDSDSLFEAVVVKDKIQELIKNVEAFFGSPVWPSKTNLSGEIRRIIDNYGGITPGQTLYFRSEGTGAVFAMFWPWQDGIHTTVKIVKTP